jgi:hypothetical protein
VLFRDACCNPITPGRPGDPALPKRPARISTRWPGPGIDEVRGRCAQITGTYARCRSAAGLSGQRHRAGKRAEIVAGACRPGKPVLVACWSGERIFRIGVICLALARD